MNDKNYIFLQKYFQLQHSIMFDQLKLLKFATIGYCNGDKTHFWNQALVNRNLTEKQIGEIEKRMRLFKRSPALYFENKRSLLPLVSLLKNKDYDFGFEDSWMFWKGEKIDSRNFSQIKKVTNEKDLKVFLKTFDLCYQKNDPQNPFGKLGDYLLITEKVWHRHWKSGRVEYFLVYDANQPVAVSTLNNYQSIGYISNIGSLRKVRGRGFGKLATQYCVEQSERKGNKLHCLATEEGTYPNEFYKRIGFKTRFTAVCYKKKSGLDL